MPNSGDAAPVAGASAGPGEPPLGLASDPEHPLSVAALDRAIKDALDGAFAAPVWVEGEVTGLRAAPSGHLYFGLKDQSEDAAVDVVVYRSNVTARLRDLCADGARVRLRGRPTLWAPRGRLQFIADRGQAAGRGALLEALERLKVKLTAEGLFAEERKRPLPTEPRVIGVVTSASGAVIHDICRVAFRRGGAHILLAAASVQGSGAPGAICRAIAQLERIGDVDVIVVARGGGSADDLSAFNDESVVRAIAACRVPVVSAVGHDVDVTLVDFASDARAATPSQAAELLVPDRNARRELLRRTRLHMVRAVSARVDESRVASGRLASRLGDPRLALASHQQLLDDRLSRISARVRALVHRRRVTLARMQQRLATIHPREVVARQRAENMRLHERLLTRRDGSAVRTASDAHIGERLTVRVHLANIEADVRAIEPLIDEGGASPPPSSSPVDEGGVLRPTMSSPVDEGGVLRPTMSSPGDES
jgi:exodeoxyribonuclease VII large subunit